MLSVVVHKNIAEYQPKVVGKLTMRTLISLVGALGSSVLTALYIYFVLGWNVGDCMIFIYAVSLPFWLCGFFRPKGMPFEQFLPLWIKAKLSTDRIFYTPSLYLSGLVRTPEHTSRKKGKIYDKQYRKERGLKGIEAYAPRAHRVII
ncbi:PrgI family protein [Streptococcus sp. Marseille-Q5986]|uniref:PrgI family protein n=1 Tax=Streptococcus sp. Marseille-Q5986 TaxID=2972782 RepID=UPI0022652C76|nr:PrgI family protein [Streptococcus sp. Marseille-Q5986]